MTFSIIWTDVDTVHQHLCESLDLGEGAMVLDGHQQSSHYLCLREHSSLSTRARINMMTVFPGMVVVNKTWGTNILVRHLYIKTVPRRLKRVTLPFNVCVHRDDLCVSSCVRHLIPRWRHQMETFSALLVLCARNSPVTGEFPTQRPVTRSLDDFFHLRLNKRLSKQSWGWWFKTPSRSLWRHCNDTRL